MPLLIVFFYIRLEAVNLRDSCMPWGGNRKKPETSVFIAWVRGKPQVQLVKNETDEGCSFFTLIDVAIAS